MHRINSLANMNMRYYKPMYINNGRYITVDDTHRYIHVHMYMYMCTRIKRALRARTDLRSHIAELCYGFMSQDYIMELHQGIITEFYYGHILRNYIIESY